MKKVDVVAAVIRRDDGAILISLRRARGERAGQWEFPGGKVEPGETEPAALQREILEELGCGVSVGRLLARTAHRYPDLEVALAFYDCRLEAGAEPRCIGVAQVEWAEPERLARYDFCEADLPVLGVIAAG